VRVQSSEAARLAALSTIAAQAKATAAAGAVGQVAAAMAARSREASRRQTRDIGTLEADLHAGVDAWLGTSTSRARGASKGDAYITAVPMQLWNNPVTDRATLVALCAERTIPAGANDSLQSLKTSLLRFNASSSTVIGARMLETLVFVGGKDQTGREQLSDYKAAVAHPTGVKVDGAAYPLAADGHHRQPPPVALFGEGPASPVPCPTPPSLPSPPSDTCLPPGAPTWRETATSPSANIVDVKPRTAVAPSTTTPQRDAPSSSLDVTPSDGSAASHSAASRQRSLVHAGQLVQAMLGEEAKRVDTIATAAGLADVKILLLSM